MLKLIQITEKLSPSHCSSSKVSDLVASLETNKSHGGLAPAYLMVQPLMYTWWVLRRGRQHQVQFPNGVYNHHAFMEHA